MELSDTYDGMCNGGKPTKSRRRVANLKGLIYQKIE
jgi:hypothetical protein